MIYILFWFLILFLHLVIFERVWFMLLVFSCDDTCLSWIEFIFDLSMWAYILVYLFEIIMRIWWWCCIPLFYDMIHFIIIIHVIMMYNIWCWCTPIQYDVHAYHSVMMLSYALWCILDVDDAYTVHTEMMMMHIWWWACIPYDDDAWKCMPYVQWKKRIISCSIIVYDEVYNDVHEQCMVVK